MGDGGRYDPSLPYAKRLGLPCHLESVLGMNAT